MDDEANKSEPKEKGELKGEHSPFGVMWRIQKETGWTDNYLLWETPWVNIRMKLIDEPHFVYGKNGKIENEEELIELLGKNNERTG